MRYQEILTEAMRGMYIRTADAASGKTIVFTNKEGQSITAVGNAVLPEAGLAYTNDTVDNLPPAARKLPASEQKKILLTGQAKLMNDLDALRQNLKISEKNWNVVNNVGKAALITLWKNMRGESVAFIRLYPAKSAGQIPFLWQNSQFARDTGYALVNAVQERSNLNLKPLTVVGNNKKYSIDDLMEQIEENLPKHTELPPEIPGQVMKLLENVRAGYDTPVADTAKNITSFEIDLGEVAAPIALLTGHFVTGAYQQVEEQLLKPLGTKWSKIKAVSFPIAGNEQLVDSYLVLNGSTNLGVSSKDGKGGAAASIQSLAHAIETSPERYEDLKEEAKYKPLFKLLEVLKEKSAVDGPLDLAVAYRIITPEDRTGIKDAIKDPHCTKKDLSKNLKKILDDKIFKPNVHSNNYMIGYHLLATVASRLVSHLNKRSKLVTAFFKEILSRSNMIQVKTKMTKKGTGAAYTSFQVIWPPVFEGEVKFNASKNYTAGSKPNGRICFKLS